MRELRVVLALALFAPVMMRAQDRGTPALQIAPSNRTLTVSADGQVTTDADLAILHVGFETQLESAKDAYAEGTQTSNAIIAALKQEGVAESEIRSEWQRLQRDYKQPHKFKLAQQWTVRTSPEKVAEVLDVAVTAGATQSGDIEWTMRDLKGLENKALDEAATRARENAATLAKGMGVQLGSLLFVSNQISSPVMPRFAGAMMSMKAEAPQPLAIEPQKVSRQAQVYAVYAIE